jgi:hypothetical protein
MSASKAKADLGLWPGEVRGIVKQTSRLAHTVAGGSIQYAREEISELVKVATAFVELGPTRTPTDGKPSKKTVNVQKLEALTHALSAALEGLEQSAGLLAFRRAEGANEHTRLEHAVLHCFLRLRNHEEVVQEMCKRVAASKTNLATFQKLVAEQTPDMDYVGAAATLEQYVHNGFREASASHAVGEEKAASISELQVCTRQNRGESFSNRATNLRNNVISPALAAAVESSVSELPALARHNAKQTRSKVLRGKATIPRMYRELTVACTVVFLLCVLLLFQMVDSSKVFSKQESGMIAVMVWCVFKYLMFAGQRSSCLSLECTHVFCSVCLHSFSVLHTRMHTLSRSPIHALTNTLAPSGWWRLQGAVRAFLLGSPTNRPVLHSSSILLLRPHPLLHTLVCPLPPPSRLL